MLPMWASSVSTTSRVPGGTLICGGSFGSKNKWHWSRRSLGVVWASVVADISFLSSPYSGKRSLRIGAENRLERPGRCRVQLLHIASPAHRVRDLERGVADGRPRLVGCV